MLTEQTSPGSVTVIVIGGLRAGDRSGVPLLVERYFERLSRVAASKVKFFRFPGMIEDEEDAANSALNDFCNDLALGKMSYVDDRESLWRTLVTITERKALQQVRRWRSLKNGGGRVIPASQLPTGPSSEGHGLDKFQFVEPSSEYIAIVKDTLRELLDSLENPLWRQAVQLWLDGDTVHQIAVKMDRTDSAVHGWFRAIRAIWVERYGEDFFQD